MRSQLSYSSTLLRWTVGLAFLAWFPFLLKEFNADKDWQGALCALLFGVGAIGSEIYMRMSRKTLTLRDGTVEVTRRGVSLGSFPASYVQYWDRRSRVRVYARLMALVLMSFGIGAAIYASGHKPTGIGLALFGLILAATIIYDFMMLWEVVVPKPEAGFETVHMSKPGGVDPISMSFAKEKRVILLGKPDVRTLLGFWPPERMREEKLRKSAAR